MSYRALCLTVGGVAVLASALGGLTGYSVATAPPPAPAQIVFQRGAIQIVLPAAGPTSWP